MNLLSLLGFSMVITFMYLITSKRMLAFNALILIPILFGLIGGLSPELGNMILEGVQKIAPTGVMLLFAIMYFGMMNDVGLFNPLILRILRVAKNDPLKIIVGTAVLALLVSLDGDGSTTYIIVTSAMLPLSKALRVRPLVFACVTFMASSAMNILPWGGPTARVMSALQLSNAQVFTPLVPCLIGAVCWVLLVAYWLGKQERSRLGNQNTATLTSEYEAELTNAYASQPRFLFYINLVLTVTLLVCLVTNVLPLLILFMTAFALATVINFRTIEAQRNHMFEHGKSALAVASMVFAAGVFTGILSGGGMVKAMGESIIGLIPASMGSNLSIITGLTSGIFTYFMSNDAYYYGMLPLFSPMATQYGIALDELGRASLLGQPIHLLSPLVPSTYLLTGLTEVNFGDFQRYTFKWVCGTVLVMVIVALLIQTISIRVP